MINGAKEKNQEINFKNCTGTIQKQKHKAITLFRHSESSPMRKINSSK